VAAEAAALVAHNREQLVFVVGHFLVGEGVEADAVGDLYAVLHFLQVAVVHFEAF
jgi:hypothetical protein